MTNDAQPLLSVKNLACGYHGKAVLPPISFDVFPGELFVMLGPNGVGKTTLFKTILGLIPKIEGEVFLSGSPSNAKGASTKSIAYVPQAHAPSFSFTVEEIVLMGRTPRIKTFSTPSENDRALAQSALGELGLEHLAHRSYTEISGGERQLVLIARALVQEPDIIVMDEPASSLDLGNQAKLLHLLSNLTKKRNLAALMTTHNPDHAFLVADKALLLTKDSSLCGTTNEVLTEHNLSHAYSAPIAILEQQDSAQEHLLRTCTLKIEERDERP